MLVHRAKMQLLIIYLILINVIAFFIYGLDKYRAKKKMWRIPENSLLFSAVLGGGLGAWIAMAVFHHKTKVTKFRITVPLAFFAWAAFLVWLVIH